MAGNVIAQARGKPGAPRNEPLSLDLMIGGASVALSGTTPAEFLGLAGQASLLVVASVSGFDAAGDPQSAFVEVSYSLNNGGAWSGWQDVANAFGAASTSGVTRHIHLSEGRLDMQPAINGAAGANALRFRKNTINGAARVALFGLGRT